jgi:hypothetical protein
LFKKYIPAVKKLSAAGWEPITLARSDDPAVWVERFRDLLTVMNGSAARASATVEYEIGHIWHLPAESSIEVIDIVRGRTVAEVKTALSIRFPVDLEPGEARALEFKLRMGARASSEPPRIPVLAWIGPPPNETTLERYCELADCGFTHSFTGFPDAASAAGALDVAGGAGVKLFLSCPDLHQKPEETVRRFKQHPALGGWFLRDEPSAADFPALADWVRKIQSVDPDRPIYINLFPNYASEGQLGCKTYREHVERFVKEVPVPVISFDHYPVVGATLRPEWYENLEIIAGAARSVAKPFWAFSLSVAHGPYPVPTLAHLRLQVFSDLAYGAQAIQYFTYWTPKDSSWDFNTAPIDVGGKRTHVYDLVRKVNGEIRGLSPVFLGARVVRVGHLGDPIPRGTSPFAPEPPVKAVATGGAGALVSLLSSGPRRYLAVVNRQLAGPMALAIELDGSRRVERIGKDGGASAVEGGTLRTNVEPGDLAILGWREE